MTINHHSCQTQSDWVPQSIGTQSDRVPCRTEYPIGPGTLLDLVPSQIGAESDWTGASLALLFDPRVPLLQFEYLHKGTVLEAEILGIFISHLGLHTGKFSLKSVISIEHVFCHLGRPFRAMAYRKETELGNSGVFQVTSQVKSITQFSKSSQVKSDDLKTSFQVKSSQVKSRI
jgi:hypothetical protein